MDKVYKHAEYENKIYKVWENSNAFTPKAKRNKKPFVMIMPPPNANDPLHIGHARFAAIQDILARYHRMKGEPTLWLPGADHAGIETQYVFEKKLAKKGKSRFDYDQKTLFKMIWDYSMENKKDMENQLRSLGASCDWTRNRFTLDPEIAKIVYKTFKNLYDDGLIYRGERIVNYCPRCATSFSQLEVNYVEQEDNFYYIDYETVTIATTRPETIFADVAIAVNPKDKRYKNLVGKYATLPLVGRKLPIIPHKLVDPEFGTGALKVTPGHDATDFEIGKDHNLTIISVIDKAGKMTNTPAKYIGTKALYARKEIVSDLLKAKKIKKTIKIKHSVGVCYKDKGAIEPMVSKQWFLKMDSLSKKALASIKKKDVKFVSNKYEKIAKHWLNNLRDWNISRQIVWGMRIPAWRCDKCLEWTITDGPSAEKCTSCGHTQLTQDNDTFDTWFSSGQWPYATLLSNPKSKYMLKGSCFVDNNPNSDFNYFFPTSLMETAYEILPFWVIRMIMLSLYSTNKVPFDEVLIHGLVRDKEGQKISKSKGNVIDPIVMVEKYGADALRMGIIWAALIETDISLSEDNIRGQRNFSNKIWNIARFVFSNKRSFTTKRPRSKNKDDQHILNELKITTKNVTKLLDKYRINEAAEEIYDFIWNKFANIYLEKSKTKRDESQKVLEYTLLTSLKLLHPFMPFVTEVIYQQGFSKGKKDLLITASWPS